MRGVEIDNFEEQIEIRKSKQNQIKFKETRESIDKTGNINPENNSVEKKWIRMKNEKVEIMYNV